MPVTKRQRVVSSKSKKVAAVSTKAVAKPTIIAKPKRRDIKAAKKEDEQIETRNLVLTNGVAVDH